MIFFPRENSLYSLDFSNKHNHNKLSNGEILQIEYLHLENISTNDLKKNLLCIVSDLESRIKELESVKQNKRQETIVFTDTD